MNIRLRSLWLTGALLVQPAQAGLFQAFVDAFSAPVTDAPEPAPAVAPAPVTTGSADQDPTTLTEQLLNENSGADGSAASSLNWAQWGLAESSALSVINAPVKRAGLLPDPLREDLPALQIDAQGEASYNPYGNMLPYVIRGEPYSLKSMSLGKRQEGMASWYGPGFNGRRTASGEVFDMHQLTAAHRTLPLPSFVRVTNLANQQSVIVRINDRGPYHSGRILDLSYGAARKIGMLSTGRVSIEPVEVSHKEPILRAGVALPPSETLYTVALGNFTDPRAAQSLQGRLMSRLPPGIPVNLTSTKLPVSVQRVEVGPLLSMQEVSLLIRAIRAVRMGMHVDTPTLRQRRP